MDTVVTALPPNPARQIAKEIRRRAGRLLLLNRLFLFLVVVPTVFALVYFGLVAHDVYISESHFVVRDQWHPAAAGLGALLPDSGFSAANNEIYSVQDFLGSRDALEVLERRLHLKQSFSRREVDWFSRFPGLDRDQSFEALLRYYRKRVVDTDLDTSSSILTLTVRAFTAADAYRINETLLQMSEQFVNRLNERARADLMKFATADVDEAERSSKAAVLAVSKYRNSEALFDPERQSGLQLEQIGRLEETLTATRQQIANVQAVAADNPQLSTLQHAARTLQSTIDVKTAEVAGGRHSLSSASAAYAGVDLERDFAAKRLEIALSSLQQARENAMKQQLYLERIAEPKQPDVAIEPKRLRDIGATLLFSLIIWGVVSLLATAVKEHSD